MANKNSHSVWKILDTMVDYYKSNDYIYDNEDEIIVVELKRDAERMLAESNIYQLYHELAQHFHIPTPVGNMNPEYAIANLWQIAYDMRSNEGAVYFYRIYVPFDGKPGIREYVCTVMPHMNGLKILWIILFLQWNHSIKDIRSNLCILSYGTMND